MRRNGETPEHVAELLCQTSIVDVSPLKDSLSHQPKQLSRFLDEADTRINESVSLIE